MQEYIPDPTELSTQRLEILADSYINEHTCMQCGEEVDYELICVSPIGDGPAVCAKCAGIEELNDVEYVSTLMNESNYLKWEKLI